ncbi:MAG: SMI1/KNR4 family protein [Pseudomonadota bacterium]
MGARLDKLLQIASAQIGLEPMQSDFVLLPQTELGAQLAEILVLRNGFYAFESALHFFHLGASDHQVPDLIAWNGEDLWRGEYEDLAIGHYFFAEDIFGGQFSILGERICAFDPETGASEQMACSFEGWADRLLADWATLTGHGFAYDWQKQNGVLPAGCRLLPKVPFVLGGAYDLENLYVHDAVKGMQARGEIACQIRGLPDGTQIELKVTD